jgi:PRTRC genetic system protein B
MESTVVFGGNSEFIFTEALLVYRKRTRYSSSGTGNEAFVTRHKAIHCKKGPPRLDTLEPLTMDFVRALSSEMKERMALEVLPPSVLAYANGTIAWWRPASAATLFFEPGTVASAISGKQVPLPALVFMVRDLQMSVAALGQNRRPDHSTKLFRAPFWNVYDKGSLCHGSMVNPDQTTVSSIPMWEEAFFNSAFTHPNYHAAHIQHADGLLGAWTEAIKRGRFQTRWLAPLDRTLDEFIQDEA